MMPGVGSLDFPERPLPSRGSLVSRGSAFSVGPKWCDAPTSDVQDAHSGRGLSRGGGSRGGFQSRSVSCSPGPRISFAPQLDASSAVAPSTMASGFEGDRPQQRRGLEGDRPMSTQGMLSLHEKMFASINGGGDPQTGFRIQGGSP